MNTSSAKAKGRRCAQETKEAILQVFESLQDDDIQVTPSGVTGRDLVFSPFAQKLFPASIECKNVEKLNVHEAYEQAVSHAKEGEIPMLFFKKNRTELRVCMSVKGLFDLMYHLLSLENACRDAEDKLTKAETNKAPC